MLSHVSLMLCSFFLIPFTVRSSDCIICIDLSCSLLILSSANSNLLFALLVNFFHYGYCTFQLWDFHWVIIIFLCVCNFTSLLTFSIWRDIVIPSLKSFYMISFTSLNKFVIATLKSLSSRSNIWASNRQFLLPAPHQPPHMGHTVLFLCMSHNFLLKTGHFRSPIIATLGTNLPIFVIVCFFICVITWTNLVKSISTWCSSSVGSALGMSTGTLE